MQQIACKIESSSSKMLQIACSMEGSSSQMLQITCKMKGSSSKMLQIACCMEGKWQGRCRGRKTEQIRKKIPRAGEKKIPARSGTRFFNAPACFQTYFSFGVESATKYMWRKRFRTSLGLARGSVAISRRNQWIAWLLCSKSTKILNIAKPKNVFFFFKNSICFSF